METHVETLYTYKGKKLGYTIREDSGYAITFDSEPMFLMYKPFLELINFDFDTIEKCALQHIQRLVRSEENASPEGEVCLGLHNINIHSPGIEKDFSALMRTNILIHLYCSFNTKPIIDVFGVENYRDFATLLQHLLHAEISSGQRELVIQSRDDERGIPKDFYLLEVNHLLNDDPTYCIDHLDYLYDSVTNFNVENPNQIDLKFDLIKRISELMPTKNE